MTESRFPQGPAKFDQNGEKEQLHDPIDQPKIDMHPKGATLFPPPVGIEDTGKDYIAHVVLNFPS